VCLCCVVLCCVQSYYGAALCVCWSPDAAFVASGGEDDLVATYSVAERQVRGGIAKRVSPQVGVVWKRGHRPMEHNNVPGHTHDRPGQPCMCVCVGGGVRWLCRGGDLIARRHSRLCGIGGCVRRHAEVHTQSYDKLVSCLGYKWWHTACRGWWGSFQASQHCSNYTVAVRPGSIMAG